MKRLTFFILATALMGICVNAQAQTTGDEARSGSVYSNLGVGIPSDYISSGGYGLGLTGVSYQDPYSSGFANPAHWGNSLLTTGTGGLKLESLDAVDNSGQSKNMVLTPSHLNLQFPILRERLGVSASLSPLTRSNFRTITTDVEYLGTGAEQDTLFSSLENRGDGGINSLELGFGLKVTDNIYVGYAASLVFASLENNITTIFSDDDYSAVQYSEKASGKGFGNRFGAQLRLPNIFRDQDRLNFGAALSLPVEIHSERIQESTKNPGSSASITIVDREGPGLGDGTIRLPMTATGGVTYEPSPYVSVSSEGLYQPWSDFEYSYDNQREAVMNDRYKVGVGMRYFPFLLGSNQFLSKFKYRLGASYDTGHLKLQGHEIETLMFSAGLGILSSRSNSSVDISFQYGIRGTKADNLVKENIWGVKLTLSLAELMFNRPKLQ